MVATSQIVDLLDKEFRVKEVEDPELAEYALTDVSRARATEAFLNEKSGLMFDFAQEVNKVYCVVFTTTEVFEQLLAMADGPSLIFTHHPLDYHEDARGFGPFPEDYLKDLQRSQIGVYAIHTPLDVGPNICVSRSLASHLFLSDVVGFYEVSGGYLAIRGSMHTADLDLLADHVSRVLKIDSVDVFDNGADEGLIAVVAGGGDQPDVLKMAKELGCTTYITGTAVHRWAFEPVQEKNREFHRLAREWKINVIGASHYHTEKCAV
ncbi:MAG: Nif3-like dinuclear metal center hexameric protein, partial [Candidatus Hodarchaeota archaeon]